MKPLEGMRVLLLEDEYLISLMAREMLESLGAETVVPTAQIQEAFSLAKDDEFDAAVLDINIRGEKSHLVAGALNARRIPFIFATGYRTSNFGDSEILQKPYTEAKLQKALTTAIDAAA